LTVATDTPSNSAASLSSRPPKKPKFNDFGRPRIEALKTQERFIHREQTFVITRRRYRIREGNANLSSASFCRPLRACVVNKDAPNLLGGNGEKVCAVTEAQRLLPEKTHV
jgi:hypothetical protein